jgi:hypothetical protein
MSWVIDRVIIDLMPAEYLIPDLDRIVREAANSASRDERPVIPGVVFEWEDTL